MKHIKKFNEGFTSATMLGGPSQIGNTGQSTSYTGPVSFQATNNVPGYIPPKGGAQEPVTYDDKLPDWPRAKLQNSLKNDINSILATLSDKESKIIQYRFGLNGHTPLSLKDIGDKYNLTKERIRQIEKKAIKRLQHPSRSEHLKAYTA